jgi:hypothetical protein
MNRLLEETLKNSSGDQFCLYADGAYTLRPWLQVGFSGPNITPEQKGYNIAMSGVRVAVEWSYKDIKQMWTTLDFSRKLKVREAPVALLYHMAALLWNCKVCLKHGSQAYAKFGCEPPSIEMYLTNDSSSTH